MCTDRELTSRDLFIDQYDDCIPKPSCVRWNCTIWSFNIRTTASYRRWYARLLQLRFRQPNVDNCRPINRQSIDYKYRHKCYSFRNSFNDHCSCARAKQCRTEHSRNGRSCKISAFAGYSSGNPLANLSCIHVSLGFRNFDQKAQSRPRTFENGKSRIMYHIKELVLYLITYIIVIHSKHPKGLLPATASPCQVRCHIGVRTESQRFTRRMSTCIAFSDSTAFNEQQSSNLLLFLLTKALITGSAAAHSSVMSVKLDVAPRSNHI